MLTQHLLSCHLRIQRVCVCVWEVQLWSCWLTDHSLSAFKIPEDLKQKKIRAFRRNENSFELIQVAYCDTLTSSSKTVGERNFQVDRNHLWHSGCPSFSCCERHLIYRNGFQISKTHEQVLICTAHPYVKNELITFKNNHFMRMLHVWKWLRCIAELLVCFEKSYFKSVGHECMMSRVPFYGFNLNIILKEMGHVPLQSSAEGEKPYSFADVILKPKLTDSVMRVISLTFTSPV